MVQKVLVRKFRDLGFCHPEPFSFSLTSESDDKYDLPYSAPRFIAKCVISFLHQDKK